MDGFCDGKRVERLQILERTAAPDKKQDIDLAAASRRRQCSGDVSLGSGTLRQCRVDDDLGCRCAPREYLKHIADCGTAR